MQLTNNLHQYGNSMNQVKPHLNYLKISSARLRSFSDGVIAIAITLLILSIKLPYLHDHVSNKALGQALIALGPSFFTYVLSFLLIARYWITHTIIFNHVEKVDSELIWINIVFLLTLSFLPFPTELMGYHPHVRLAIIIFDISISLPALCLLVTILYVQLSNHYKEEWQSGVFSRIRELRHLRRVGSIPTVALISIILSFFSETLAVYIWILLVILVPIEYYIEKKEIQLKKEFKR